MDPRFAKLKPPTSRKADGKKYRESNKRPEKEKESKQQHW